jgi:hypothetical protein
MTIAEVYDNKVQLIVADNDLPTDLVGASPRIELTSQRSIVPGVINTGVGLGRVEDL